MRPENSRCPELLGTFHFRQLDRVGTGLCTSEPYILVNTTRKAAQVSLISTEAVPLSHFCDCDPPVRCDSVTAQ